MKCPVCGRDVRGGLLERHVNSCLDTMEATQSSAQSEEEPAKKRASSVFGLLMNKPKKKKIEDTNGDTVIKTSQELDDITPNASLIVQVDEIPTLEPPKPNKQKLIDDLRRESTLPLPHRLRPKSLADYFGQSQLIGNNGILKNMIDSNNILPFILWGPPGSGKTTLIRILFSNLPKYRFIELSGADSNAKKIKEIILTTDNEFNLTGRKTILFLDEIHRFNKAIQDLFLPIIETGIAIIIGATTENPSFTLNNALLSRLTTFKMESFSLETMSKIIIRGLFHVNKVRLNLHNLNYISLNKNAVNYLAKISKGDSRISLNLLESLNAYLSTDKYKISFKDDLESPSPGVIKVDEESLKSFLTSRVFHQLYDRQGENHYDAILAFHKSVRGSNPDAAIYYLVKMLKGGEDPLFIARRMIIIASEDIGLRDNSCLPFAVAVKDAIEFVGMPEAEIILAHCAVRLAKSFKSTKSYRALRKVQETLSDNPDLGNLPIPMHLRNAPTQLMKDLGYGDTYKYNPKYLYGKVDQKYFPPELEESKFVDDIHLGTQIDDDVPQEDYEKEKKKEKEEKDENYEKYKQLREKSKFHPTSSFSYDEFLTKSEQPEYFDGDENDEYSDDPDCTNNFEQPFDEFLDPDSQPKYYSDVEEGADDILHNEI